MKTFLYSLVVMAFIGAVALAFKYHQGPIVAPVPQNPEVDVENPNIVARQLCFIWNHEAGDSMKLSMDLRGGEVIGEFYWLPFEKDKKTGIFRGTVSAVDPYAMRRTINAWWEATSEGVTNTEEIIITFGEGTANVGWGAMNDRGDGVYVYADPKNLSWEPNLQDTDCGDEAMD